LVTWFHQQFQDVTFIFTDQDVINENFLEIMNSILATGEAIPPTKNHQTSASANQLCCCAGGGPLAEG